MNKILLATALILPTFAFAATEGISTTAYEGEVATFEQAAIDPLGRCKIFTNNNIPNTWKRVNSCKDYAPAKTGLSPEEVLKRRWQRRLSAHSTKETIKKEPVLRRSRLGSGTLTRGGADRVTSLGIKRRARRTTTSQNFGSTKQFLLKDSRRKTTSATERVRRRNARSGIKSGSATDMVRDGQLSGNFWSTEAARRNQRLEAQSKPEALKNYLDNRQYISKQGRKDKKDYVYKGPSLRRVYRGERKEGSMEN